MGLLRWLTGKDLPPDEPPPVSALAASDDGETVAAMLTTGRVVAWRVAERRVLVDRAGASPGLAMSGDGRLLVSGDGDVVDLTTGEVVEAGPFHAHPVFLGDELLRVGWGRMRLGRPGGPSRLDPDQETPDPSANLEALVTRDHVALIDPAWDRPWVMERSTGAWVKVRAGLGTVQGATWAGSHLITIQEGRLRRVDVTEGFDGKPVVTQRHGLQTLGVAADEGRVITVGLDADDRYELALEDGGERLPLPGPAPERPQVMLLPDGVLVETWSGWVRLDGRGGEVSRLDLASGRRRRRPVALRGGRLVLPGERVLVATTPPAVYALSDATCVATLELPPVA